MAHLQKSVVTLRITGESLIPEEVTKLLCVSPTRAERKGDQIEGKKSGDMRIARTGRWSLRAGDREPEDIDGQIHEILSRMTGDISIWKHITDKYHVDLFCGLSCEPATKA